MISSSIVQLGFGVCVCDSVCVCMFVIVCFFSKTVENNRLKTHALVSDVDQKRVISIFWLLQFCTSFIGPSRGLMKGIN